MEQDWLAWRQYIMCLGEVIGMLKPFTHYHIKDVFFIERCLNSAVLYNSHSDQICPYHEVYEDLLLLFDTINNNNG